LGDGSSADGDPVSHTYAAAGTYTVSVVATNCGGSDAAARSVFVGVATLVPPPPPAPVALGPGQQVSVSLTLVNTGTAGLEWGLSEVPDAPWLAEAPESGAIFPGNSTDVLLFYTAPMTPGVYTTNLRISSNDPAQPLVDVPVEMDVAGPCANVEVISVTTQIAGCDVTFSATLTGTGPFAYLWTFGDGMTSTAVMPTHTYAQTGIYSGTLAVENCGGAGQDLANFTVQVECAPPQYSIYLPLVTRGYTP
jgi:PKD repeat protein